LTLLTQTSYSFKIRAAADALVQRLGMDRAVTFSALTRIWALLAGPVSLVLIASRFSPELQGYYYTFNSLLALTVFVELGFGTVVQQFASHEWAHLTVDADGRVVGDRNAVSRLAHLTKLSFTWYGIAGALAFLCLVPAGYVMFSGQQGTGIQWAAPWILQAIISGLALAVLPAWTILDGCGQMPRTYAARLVMSVVGSIGFWLAIVVGVKLWAVPLVGGLGIAMSIGYLWWRYRGFFRSVFASKITMRMNWRDELWPMQWRIALSWLSGYFIFSFFTPVVFRIEGPVSAGQMGMTWAVITALLQACVSWVSTKAPAFGGFIAHRDSAALDSLFWRSMRQMLAIGLLGSLVVWGGIAGLNAIHSPYADRFLAPLPVAVFLMATLVNIGVSGLSVYLRAHKQEPYLVPSVLTGVIVAVSCLVVGPRFGVLGIALAYLATLVVLLIPELVIFRRCRLAWHGAAPAKSKAPAGVEVRDDG
jgi:hypothetical protein